jgi:hypothetical protein
MASVCFGQVPESDPVIKPTADKAGSQVISFPYIAQITGTDVYVRSGPGTAYYYCGKINAPARVEVTGEKHGWLQILPPAGSFSWISKNYVKLDPDNPGIGIVTGDSVDAVRSVRVWAGSDYVEPMRSHSLQAKLNEGDQVKLFGAESEKGDYYKIFPPPGAHLWVSDQFAKYIGPVAKPEPVRLPPRPEPAPEIRPEPKREIKVKPRKIKVKPAAPKPVEIIEKPEPPVVSKKPSQETVRLKECYQLAEQIEAELAKPLEKQNYGRIKKNMNAIIGDPKAGKAKRYAEYQLDRVGRFEMALEVGNEVKRQDAKLQKIRKQIKNRSSAKASNIPDPGKFIATGHLKPSQIYTTQTGQERYLLVDRAGKIICYVMPADTAYGANMAQFTGRKVGLLGQAIKDPYNAVSLVKFTEIVGLDE